MPHMTRTLRNQVAEARTMHAEGAQLLLDAADMLREVARQLKADGWKGVDIAAALQISQQRVSQLLATKQDSY